MANPTNEQLAKKIEHVELDSRKRHKTLLNRFNNFEKKVWDYVAPLHDYIEQQKGYDKAMEASGGNGVTINKEVWGFIKLLAIIIAVLVGANKYL